MVKGNRFLNRFLKEGICSLICLLGVVFGILLAWSPAVGQETGKIAISIRDVETGYALPAFVSVSKVMEDGSTGPVIDSFQASSGEIFKRYTAGKYIIEIKIEGYKPMKSWFVIEAGKNSEIVTCFLALNQR